MAQNFGNRTLRTRDLLVATHPLQRALAVFGSQPHCVEVGELIRNDSKVVATSPKPLRHTGRGRAKATVPIEDKNWLAAGSSRHGIDFSGVLRV